MKIDKAYIERLVEEGRRVGKTPWSCSEIHEIIVFDRLNDTRTSAEGYPEYPQESFEESKTRRNLERLEKEFGESEVKTAVELMRDRRID